MEGKGTPGPSTINNCGLDAAGVVRIAGDSNCLTVKVKVGLSVNAGLHNDRVAANSGIHCVPNPLILTRNVAIYRFVERDINGLIGIHHCNGVVGVDGIIVIAPVPVSDPALGGPGYNGYDVAVTVFERTSSAR